MKFSEQINKYLPYVKNPFMITKISIDELMYIRSFALNENLEMTTCRPIHIKNDDEMRKEYESTLSNEFSFIFSIYLTQLMIGSGI